MTIIEPNKNRIRINLLSLMLITLTIVGALFSVYIYNQIVALRYQFSNYEEQLNNARVANAESKDKLYKILSGQNSEAFARTLGLIKDNKPVYLQDKWEELASRY